MPAWLVAFFFAAGVSTWIYSKLMRKTGEDSATSLKVVAAIFIFSFIIFWFILSNISKLF